MIFVRAEKELFPKRRLKILVYNSYVDIVYKQGIGYRQIKISFYPN